MKVIRGDAREEWGVREQRVPFRPCVSPGRGREAVLILALLLALLLALPQYYHRSYAFSRRLSASLTPRTFVRKIQVPREGKHVCYIPLFSINRENRHSVAPSRQAGQREAGLHESRDAVLGVRITRLGGAIVNVSGRECVRRD